MQRHKIRTLTYRKPSVDQTQSVFSKCRVIVHVVHTWQVCASRDTTQTNSVDTVQEELQSMQARAQYAESRAELQSLRKVSLHPRSTPDPKLGLVICMQ